jgi:hypothetical protein
MKPVTAPCRDEFSLNQTAVSHRASRSIVAHHGVADATEWTQHFLPEPLPSVADAGRGPVNTAAPLQQAAGRHRRRCGSNSAGAGA